MGHDIRAWKTDENERQHLHALWDVAQRRVANDDDAWIRLYEDYVTATQAAYLRRNAGDPLNSVIYKALRAEDCYSGVSGDGSEREYTADELCLALIWLTHHNNYEALKHYEPHSSSEDLLNVFRSMGLTVLEETPKPPDIYREIKFVENCIKHLSDTSRKTVVVNFG